jgi:hypothetical protein
MLRDAVALPAELEAVTVKVAMAAAAVGVPLITPVMVLNTKPAGRDGLTLYAATAPPPLVGLFGVISIPWV